MKYPRYEHRKMPRVSGRELVEEFLDAGHVRIYFPDLMGRLRLVFINHETIDALSEDVLQSAFGVTYLDLGLDWAKAFLHPHPNLDDRCLWPKELFPEPQPQPASMPMPRLPDLESLFVPDAWI